MAPMTTTTTLCLLAAAAAGASAQAMYPGTYPAFVPVPAVHTVTVVPPFLAKPAPLPACSALGDQSRAACNYCRTFLEKGTAGACASVKDQIAGVEARLAAGAAATECVCFFFCFVLFCLFGTAFCLIDL
jgi:hypothetical protein